MSAKPCIYCDDGDGLCVFPYYGVGPHKHVGTEVMGSTVALPSESWPENYREDPDEPGLGTYTHCLHCGAGKEQP